MLEKFEQFLEKIDLKGYRKKYASIKIVEMDLPKKIQAIAPSYEVYWVEENLFPSRNFMSDI